MGLSSAPSGPYRVSVVNPDINSPSQRVFFCFENFTAKKVVEVDLLYFLNPVGREWREQNTGR